MRNVVSVTFADVPSHAVAAGGTAIVSASSLVSTPQPAQPLRRGRLGVGPASCVGIVAAFEDVGASSPVTLSEEDRVTLLELLDVWAGRVGREQLPARVADLRDAISDDTPVLYKVKHVG